MSLWNVTEATRQEFKQEGGRIKGLRMIEQTRLILNTHKYCGDTVEENHYVREKVNIVFGITINLKFVIMI